MRTFQESLKRKTAKKNNKKREGGYPFLVEISCLRILQDMAHRVSFDSLYCRFSFRFSVAKTNTMDNRDNSESSI